MTGKTVRRDQRKIVAEKTQATETKKNRVLAQPNPHSTLNRQQSVLDPLLVSAMNRY
jgi:hypothetical protein